MYFYFRNANECNGNICTWQVSDKLKKKGAEIDMCYWIPEDSLPAPQVVGLVFSGNVICSADNDTMIVGTTTTSNMIDIHQEVLASNENELKNEIKIIMILFFISILMLL